MRNTIAGAIFVVLGAGAAAIGANMRGSDTLEDVTRFMLNPAGSPFCPGTTGIVYLGEGSTAGEQAMTGTGTGALDTPSQSTAPMSRPLGAAVCATEQGSAASAAGIFVCLDGLAIFANAAAAPSCSVKFTGGTGSTDWRDVLRMVYAGAGPGTATAPRDCNSAERRALVNNWGSLYTGTCTGTPACAQLSHAWRRADLSGTTDTFLSLLQLPAASANPFCNGVGIATPITLTNTTDFADNDPVRRPCPTAATGGDQVCNKPLPGADQNSLGLVQVVFVPGTHGALTAAQVYATTTCTPGLFAWRDLPAGIAACPYGLPPVVGTCLLPHAGTTASPNFACLNSRTNRGFFLGASVPQGDGRVYNLAVRNSAGSIRNDATNRRLLGAYYRIHTTTVQPGGTGTGCQHQNSTLQIACLTAAQPCSWGFAGREGISQAGTNPLRVKGRSPTVAEIQALITDTVNSYPISRRLYFNSVVNNNITGSTVGTLAFRQAQQALKTCFADTNRAKTACEASGFVESPTGPACEDFNEQTVCGAGSNNNACP